MRTIDNFDSTLRLIRRANYRFAVKQAGGRFIEVKDFDEEIRRVEFNKLMEDRAEGYSGYDEYDEDGRPV